MFKGLLGLITVSLLISNIGMAQKKLTIVTEPTDAEIFQVKGSQEVKLGNGTAVLTLDKDDPISVKVKKDGFQSVTKSYLKMKNGELIEKITLDKRIVKISTIPADGQIIANGSILGKGATELIINPDQSVSVEVKKAGYISKTKVYYNKSGYDVPPLNDILTLETRSVQVKLIPGDVTVFVDAKINEFGTDIMIPKNSCVAVKFVKEGFTTLEKTYCSKENMPEPPLSETIILKDREISINTTPTDAQIKVDGEAVATGNYILKLPEGSCKEVIVEKAGFVRTTKKYCNSQNYQTPPVAEHIPLKEDEAYSSSTQSDQANVNFSLVIGAHLDETAAWKIISQIVQVPFDVIELSDKETGYLRTSWVVKNFQNSTVRTRVIVKLGDTNPLKYTVKVCSEYSGEAGTSVKEDERFKPWDRLLNSYKDLINEFQVRLK